MQLLTTCVHVSRDGLTSISNFALVSHQLGNMSTLILTPSLILAHIRNNFI